MRFFIAGIMQGSRRDTGIHGQNYRARARHALETHVPDADVYDPLAEHHESVEYDDDKGREVFYYHNRLCREVDAVVAFVPEASMGTAIEMWEAYEHGRGVVIVISPLTHNWAVKFCSHLSYSDVDGFEADLASGELLEKIENLLAARAQPSPGNS